MDKACCIRADTTVAQRPLACGNCSKLRDLHHFRGHVGDSADDHRAGGHWIGRTIGLTCGYAYRLPGLGVVATARGTGPIAAALRAGLLDEVILHVVPVLLGGGTRYFDELPASVSLTPLEVVVAPETTHLRYAVAR